MLYYFSPPFLLSSFLHCHFFSSGSTWLQSVILTKTYEPSVGKTFRFASTSSTFASTTWHHFLCYTDPQLLNSKTHLEILKLEGLITHSMMSSRNRAPVRVQSDKCCACVHTCTFTILILPTFTILILPTFRQECYAFQQMSTYKQQLYDLCMMMRNWLDMAEHICIWWFIRSPFQS